MTQVFYLIPLIAGLALLVKGADVFVDGARDIAVKLGIPPLVVGLTVVALGTSAPEAAISITSATQENGSMAIAGVFGSNIVNTLVILGVTALIAEVPLRRSTLRLDIPFVLVVTAVLLMLCVHDGQLGRVDAALLLVLLGCYVAYLVRTARKGIQEDEQEADKTVQRGTIRLALLCILGAMGISAGAHLTVEGASGLAQMLGMSERVAGLTVIALGTSLPELVTSLSAARKGQTDIAIGNVVGSSIFNVLFVLGVSGVIAPIPFERELLFDGMVALAAIALLWVACVRTRSLRRAGGVSLLAGYAIYLGAVLAG